MAYEYGKIPKRPIEIQTERRFDPDFVKSAAVAQHFLQKHANPVVDKTKKFSKRVFEIAKDAVIKLGQETSSSLELSKLQQESRELKTKLEKPELLTPKEKVQIENRLEVLRREQAKSFQESSERFFPAQTKGGLR